MPATGSVHHINTKHQDRSLLQLDHTCTPTGRGEGPGKGAKLGVLPHPAGTAFLGTGRDWLKHRSRHSRHTILVAAHGYWVACGGLLIERALEIAFGAFAEIDISLSCSPKYLVCFH